jgi:hypothetical protein
MSGKTTGRGLGRAATTAGEGELAGGMEAGGAGGDGGAGRRRCRDAGARGRRARSSSAIAFHVASSSPHRWCTGPETSKAREAMPPGPLVRAGYSLSATSDRDAALGEGSPGAVETATTGRERKHRASLMAYQVRRVNTLSRIDVRSLVSRIDRRASRWQNDHTMKFTRATVCCCSEARVLSRRHRVALVAD